jgi:hypothetical protein
MTGSARKLALVAAVLVALVLAAGAGAIVKDTIFTIQYHHYAWLPGTKVFCENNVSHKQRAFVCSEPLPRGSDSLPRGVPRTYIVVVGQPGVEVGRWSGTGKTASTIRKFNNP